MLRFQPGWRLATNSDAEIELNVSVQVAPVEVVVWDVVVVVIRVVFDVVIVVVVVVE